MRIQIEGTNYIDAKEVAKLFNCSQRTVMRYREAGHFETTRIGRTWYYTEDSVANYLKERGIVCYAK